VCINCSKMFVSMTIWFWLWIVRAPDADDNLGPAGVWQHPLPALACGFGKDLTPFHMAWRWNEQTQLAPWRMSSCKSARCFQSWKHLETSQQHPADTPGIKMASAMSVCFAQVGPELILCCSFNFSHASQYFLHTL